MTETPGELLARLYAEKSAVDRDGRTLALNSEISPAFSDALTRVVRENACRTVVEIGMAFGASSLAILEGLPEGGTLLSIDPFQQDYGRIGETLVHRSSRAGAHRLIELPDYLALPQILDQGLAVDLVYIDGMHTFDYVALDAFYADKLIKPGGIIAFNDCGFRSIHKYLKFFRGQRHYDELDVGLVTDCRGANVITTIMRNIEQRSNQDRYFRKIDNWEPPHNYFKNF